MKHNCDYTGCQVMLTEDEVHIQPIQGEALYSGDRPSIFWHYYCKTHCQLPDRIRNPDPPGKFPPGG